MRNSAATVVVVDDEPDILDLICVLLEDEGYTVICLSHPVYTEDLTGHEPHPRLFMLDIMLPTMSGLELAQRLRGSGFADTPMIAMSASPEMLQAAEQTGLFQHLLNKPFDVDALLQAVERQVGTSSD